jgi:chromosome segregation ATPase
MDEMNSVSDRRRRNGFDRERTLSAGLAAMLIICLCLVVGWTLHYRKYKDYRSGPASSGQVLSEQIRSLRAELDALSQGISATLTTLADNNQSLANTNKTLAKKISDTADSLSGFTAENMKLVGEMTRYYNQGTSGSAGSTKSIAELTAAVKQLTDDLSAANKRINALAAQLQTKTEEAADLSIKVNTLVEMVARLRVTAGVTSADINRAAAAVLSPSEPNSPPPAP